MKLNFSFLRLGDWFIKYSFVIASIIIVIFASNKFYANEFIGTMIFSITGFCFAFAFNYYVERDTDEKVGKNRVKGVGKVMAYVLFIVMIAVMIAIPLYFSNFLALGISVFYILMSIIYSIKPFYLKARGILSVVSQAVFLDIPHFLFYLALTGGTVSVLVIYLSIWLFLVTAKGAMIHQILDHDNDAELSLKTFAVVYGKERTIKITDVLVLIIFAYGLASLLLFDYPFNVIIALIVIFSNPRYKKMRMGIKQKNAE